MTRKIFRRVALAAGVLALLVLPSIGVNDAKAQTSNAAAANCLGEYVACLSSPGADPSVCLQRYLDCIGGSR